MYFKSSGIDIQTGMYKIVDVDDSENFIFVNSGYLATSIVDILNNNMRIINKKMINSKMQRIEVKFVQILSLQIQDDHYIVDSLIYYDLYLPVNKLNSLNQIVTDFEYKNSIQYKSQSIIYDTLQQSTPNNYKIEIGLDDKNDKPSIKHLILVK